MHANVITLLIKYVDSIYDDIIVFSATPKSTHSYVSILSYEVYFLGLAVCVYIALK